VLTRLQEEYRRADERRQKSGRVQSPSLLELGAKIPTNTSRMTVCTAKYSRWTGTHAALW
jgi:hypothetical protein